MGGAIYLILGKELIEMTEEKYALEDELQGHLALHPDILAGDQVDSEAPRRWVLVSREVPIPSKEGGAGRWSLDHLFVDQDGIPTFVEAKRSSDTRLRREVVGQMLDYAANALAYWPSGTIRNLFEDDCRKKNRDAAKELTKVLGTDPDPSSFWTKVETNLESGNVRMIFVADEIPAELKQIVEFLNKQMHTAEVLALEIRQYVGKGQTTLVPRVVSQTLGPESQPWNEGRFLDALEKSRGKDERAIAGKIYDWATRKSTRIAWGRGKQYGSFTPVLEHKGEEFHPFGVTTNGYLGISFGTIQNRPPFDSEEKRLELLKRLNSFLDAKLPEDAINRYPTVRLSALRGPGVLEGILGIFDWFVDEVKTS
ncbi:MAG: hypothetical protein LAO07_17830 [Acidobacteriia bacterium]|nr:hypothetical protein [Terriglobia bacterium]